MIREIDVIAYIAREVHLRATPCASLKEASFDLPELHEVMQVVVAALRVLIAWA